MLYSLLAMVLADRRVWSWLLSQAIHTPYLHIDDYMLRWWLVPYQNEAAGPGCGMLDWRKRPIARLIQKLGFAVRIHLILRPDRGDAGHSHPWNARTFIMSGSYIEDRYYTGSDGRQYVRQFMRTAGDTAALRYDEFHRISWVSGSGVLTLFVTGQKQGTWYFLRPNGERVHYVDWLAEEGQ